MELGAKVMSEILYFLTHFCEDNLFSFYKTFVEHKSRFQFYGKSERKHVKYFFLNAQFRKSSLEILD